MLKEGRSRHRIPPSVVPALLAWGARLPPPLLDMLAAGLAGWRLWEYLADVPAFPLRFARRRDHLTLTASARMLMGLLLLAVSAALA